MFFIVVGELFRMTPEQLETVFSNCFKKLCLKTVLNEAGQFGLAK
jgi:Mlc titration factor MtfA (ptsG expression regulator)